MHAGGKELLHLCAPGVHSAPKRSGAAVPPLLALAAAAGEMHSGVHAAPAEGACSSVFPSPAHKGGWASY